MGKKMRRVLALFLTLSLLFGMMVVTAGAEEKIIDKTAKWTDDSYKVADVTLSVPGDVKVEGADIVFVVDKSSCGSYATAQFKEMFEELAAAQAQSGATIKVGLVQFNYTDHLDIPLTELTTANIDKLLGMIGTYESGTNIESGLLTAKKMLDDDKDVPAANKHVILISDGLTWVYDDENGSATTILWNNNGSVSSGIVAYNVLSANGGYDLPIGYTWDTYWPQIQEWVKADGNAYDYNISDYDQRGTDAWKAKLQAEGKAVALTTEEGKKHAVNVERAMYDAWQAYTALQDAGYNCYVNNLATESAKECGYHFMNMLAGDQKAVDFESIKNTIIYYVSKNSYVEDVIGYGDDYNFDFMVDGKITLTVGGNEYKTTKLETAKAGFDASYEFTAPGADEATFWLDYVKGNGTSEEKFIWTFGEDLSAFYPAKLDYQVELVSIVNDPTEAEAVVDTNKSATLHPVDSEGKEGTTEEFPVPHLNIPKYKVSYVYNGEVPAAAKAVPATKYYFAGDNVTVAGDDEYRVTDYVFSGWQDPCNELINGTMPAHDVTLVGYYVPMNDTVDPPIGIKTDKETTGNDYEVTIAVPGDGETVKIHDEVILILDGSYSCDEEWDDMKKNIMEIGEAVLGGACRTQMTIISFGMGDHIVAEGIKSLDELAEIMKATLPGQLLYGRSSTNCEVGFTAALKYIERKQAELAEVDVVFISDGGINTDETPRVFDNWAFYCDYVSDLALAKSAIEFPLLYGNTQPETFYETFGDKYDGWAASDILKDIFVTNAATYTDKFFMDYCDKIWAEVYAYSGLTLGKEYPISVVERAFVKFDKEKDTYVQNLFYYATYKSKSVTYPEMGARTIAAAEKLAACMKVDELYLVRYANHGNGWWMDDVEKGKNYIQADDVAGLLDVIGPMTEDLAQTNYTNVVITDYMSKWVLLHTDSISIKNDTTGETIWTIKDGWAEGVEKPTAKENPVVVELVAPEDYEKGGVDVIGNTNGDIYKLTWYVKDDCLLRTDNYSLHYDVTVDTAEEGCIPGIEYPANGNTYVDFDEDGHNDIEVPNVTIPAYTVTYKDINGNVILHQAANLATGTQIPGCENPADYTENGVTFKFKGWTLISGIEGENNTVGTTDLIYLSVYEAEPVHTLGSIVVNKNTTGVTTPVGATFQLQKLNGETWTNVGEAVAYSSFVNNAYKFAGLEEGTYRIVESGAEVDGYTLETTYSDNVVLTKTTAENGDTSVNSGEFFVTNTYEPEDIIEIPDDDVPLTDVPQTGDPILQYVGLAITSGVAAIFVGKIGKKKEDEE